MQIPFVLMKIIVITDVVATTSQFPHENSTRNGFNREQ